MSGGALEYFVRDDEFDSVFEFAISHDPSCECESLLIMGKKHTFLELRKAE